MEQYELAFKMQSSVPELTNLKSELNLLGTCMEMENLRINIFKPEGLLKKALDLLNYSIQVGTIM